MTCRVQCILGWEKLSLSQKKKMQEFIEYLQKKEDEEYEKSNRGGVEVPELGGARDDVGGRVASGERLALRLRAETSKVRDSAGE